VSASYGEACFVRSCPPRAKKDDLARRGCFEPCNEQTLLEEAHYVDVRQFPLLLCHLCNLVVIPFACSCLSYRPVSQMSTTTWEKTRDRSQHRHCVHAAPESQAMRLPEPLVLAALDPGRRAPSKAALQEGEAPSRSPGESGVPLLSLWSARKPHFMRPGGP